MNIKDNDMPRISVVVPVYGVEDYLKRCVDSIVAQTYTNLEIILVDDGSKDRSGAICDELAASDSRIKVIHKPNGGLSSARNAGVRASTGDYIGFIDSDDWIHPEMYAYLYEMLSKEGAEASQIGIANSGVYPYTFADFSQATYDVYRNKDILQNFMTKATNGSGVYSVCRCLFKRSLIEDIAFREGKINEDIDYKYKALSQCSAFCVSEFKMYCYFQSTGSITTDGLCKKDFDLYDAAEALYELTRDEEYGDIRFLGEVKKARTAFSLLCKIAYYGIKDPSLDRKTLVKQLTSEHRKNLCILLKAPLPLSRKVISLLLAVNIKMLEFPLCVMKKLKNN